MKWWPLALLAFVFGSGGKPRSSQDGELDGRRSPSGSVAQATTAPPSLLAQGVGMAGDFLGIDLTGLIPPTVTIVSQGVGLPAT